jgi:hypothetical protein
VVTHRYADDVRSGKERRRIDGEEDEDEEKSHLLKRQVAFESGGRERAWGNGADGQHVVSAP